ncbi:hypothetical protein FS837_010274 [Tulasnella sp. UAMH 9824]|nr:hypothetical protein FS837_010274 [Tulasnella sp. UAMH 9824]
MRYTTLFIVALVVAAWRAAAQDDPTTTNTANDANITPASTSTYALACTTHGVSGTNSNYVAGGDCSCTSEEPQSAAEDCITTSWTSEEDAAATGFRTELCSNGDQPTKSIHPSALSATSSPDIYTGFTWQNARTGVAQTLTRGLPSSIKVTYTPTATSIASAIASAIPSDNAAVSVNTVALWQPVLGLIMGHLILLP